MSSSMLARAPRSGCSKRPRRRCRSTWEGRFSRSIDQLRELLSHDPYKPFKVSPKAKRIVTFLRGRPTAKIKLPVEMDNARILTMKDGEIFSAYLRTPKGPVFMGLIEKTFGKEQTTRTWDTVAKVAR